MSRRLREMRLSRARARRPAPEPPSPALRPFVTPQNPAAPEQPEKFTEEAQDLDAIRKSVEDAAAVSAGVWLSYLFALFYIGIAAGAVTHTDLLLGRAVNLPFLGVELPLVAFFVLAPILFIISHAYTLVHFVMLGAKARMFHDELFKQLPDAPDTREGLRRQLPSNIFVQFLAGPEDIRKGGLGLILNAIAWISLVISPVLLLLLIEAQFLPYHLEWVTWVQRFAVLADIILLWALWPTVLDGRSKIAWPRVWRHKVFAVLSLVPIWLAFITATFPGDFIDQRIGPWNVIPPNRVTAWLGQEGWTSVHNILFHGKVDQTTLCRMSYFSDTLVIADFDALQAAKIASPEKLGTAKHTLALRGLNLKGAVFLNADLRRVDLTEAQLQGAALAGAQLQGAILDGAQLQAATLHWAKLHGANLNNARLQGANLTNAKLQGATLSKAALQGATLDSAEIEGASLNNAELQGAELEKSTLNGTDISGAEVWRAAFDASSLIAVSADGLSETAMPKDEFDNLRAQIEQAPEGEERNNALERIEKLNPNNSGNMASARETLEKRSVARTAQAISLVDQLKTLACSVDENALYIVRGLIVNGRISDSRTKAASLVKAIVSPKAVQDCPVSAALTEADKAALNKLAEEPGLSKDQQ
ncbi:MAG TPA: pentapeptide repeat-containing protein [Methylocella sp.]|nr:pentapeptide repeat-containing protein [Methylocella sp.]